MRTFKQQKEPAAIIHWLNRHERELRKYEGMWVVIHENRTKQIVAASKNLSKAIQKFKRLYPTEIPFVHKIPRKGRIYIL